MALPFTCGPIVELPFVRTSLVGRIAEIATARTLVLDDSVPVLTITGPGGVGKTRLALAIARDIASEFADGVFFVDLTPFRNPAQVLPAIAQVLELRAHGDQSLSDLVGTFLKPRQLLLMLDNFEQVLPAASEIAVLLAACPALQVLATSRAPLRIRGEHLFPISPLALPIDGSTVDLDELGRIDALTLFTQRARAANPLFALTAANAATVTDICRRVDGLPLAIELAAARLRHLSPEALLSLLSHRLKVLTDGDRDAPSRQRTQRDTISWSYDLLTEDEQTVFRRFAVFVGGFDAEAALAVAGKDPIEGARMLGALVDQSLVQRYERLDGAVRFGMLETVREFALEHLEQSGELLEAQKAHSAYFHDLTERAEVDMYETDPRGALDRLEVEYPNCLAALDYFAASRDADRESWMAAMMAEFWQNRGRLSEGIARLSDVIERGHHASPVPRAKAMMDLSLLVREIGDCERASQLTAEAERLARTASHEGRLAQVLFVRAWNIGYCLEAWDDVVPLLEETLERITAVEPDSPLRPAALTDLGWALTRLGEVARGRGMIEDALRISWEKNRGFSISKDLTILGCLDQEAGDASLAADRYRQALEVHEASRLTLRTVYPLAGLAGLTQDRGNAEWTARLLGMIEAVWEQTGAGSTPPRLEKWQGIVDRARRNALADLGDEPFSTEFANGRALSIETAIAEAISIARAIAEGLDVPSPISEPTATPVMHKSSARPAAQLSRREREVLTLLVDRWTATEIAERLSVSPRTIESHVASIYNKLGVNNRREAAAHAASHGLA